MGEVSIVPFSTPDRIRTCDPLLRRQMLYPAELRARIFYIDKFNENSFEEKMKSSIHDDIVTKIVFNDIQEVLVIPELHLFHNHVAVET